MKNIFLPLIAVAIDAKVTLGATVSDPLSMDLEEALNSCNNGISCAGITQITHNDSDYEVHAHTFISSMSNNDPQVVTHPSTNAFVLHHGKFVSKRGILKQVTNWDLNQAKEYCSSHPKCVGYSYPTYSPHPQYTENVTFFSSIDGFESFDDDSWRSFLINDVSRASNVNSSSLLYDDAMTTNPYKSCCTDGKPIPTIEELKAADTLERIPCTISREDFYEKFESQRKPVILVGCDEPWPAKHRWTKEKLIPRFDNSTEWRVILDQDVGHVNGKWSDIVQAMKNDEDFYIFDTLEHPHGKELEQDYERPPPFQNADLYRNLVNFPENYGTKRWFCVGRKGTGTMPHVDPLGTDAWNSVIQGYKWWIIYPKGVTQDMVECDESCSIEGPLVSHWYSSVGINAKRTEYVQGQRPFHVLQAPGETIYVPYGRVHSVFNMRDSIAVTENYGSPANLENIWDSLVRYGEEQHWKYVYNQQLTHDQRKLVREFMWQFVYYNEEETGEHWSFEKLVQEFMWPSEDNMEEETEEYWSFEEEIDEEETEDYWPLEDEIAEEETEGYWPLEDEIDEKETKEYWSSEEKIAEEETIQ